MVIQDKDIQEFKKLLDKMREDFREWEHISLTKGFINKYKLNYFHTRAILEMKLLDVRSRLGNARQKEYRWAGGDPTLVMARKLLELTEEAKAGKIDKHIDYTYADKVEALRAAIDLSDIRHIEINDYELEKIFKAVEYISEHEWDIKFHDLLKIVKSE